MKIENGKFYTTRDRRLVGPARDTWSQNVAALAVVGGIGGLIVVWRADGSERRGAAGPGDIIAEAPLQIEAGKFYRNRAGLVVGPIGARVHEQGYPFGINNPADSSGGTGNFGWRIFEADGTAYSRPHDNSLVAEVPAHGANEPAVPTASSAVMPHIVAVVEGGGPAPATRPKVHESRDAAMAEARRLAVANPGKEFGVYARIGGVAGTVTLAEVA